MAMALDLLIKNSETAGGVSQVLKGRLATGS